MDPLVASLKVAASGLEAQSTRIRIVSENLANARSTGDTPGADPFHYNHFHLDLAMHGRTNTGPRRYCRPKPAQDLLPPPGRPDGLPPAPDVEEPMDVSRARPRRAAPVFAASPVDLHGPNFAFPAAVGQQETRLVAPVLPPEGDIDRTPTSSSDASDDE